VGRGREGGGKKGKKLREKKTINLIKLSISENFIEFQKP